MTRHHLALFVWTAYLRASVRVWAVRLRALDAMASELRQRNRGTNSLDGHVQTIRNVRDRYGLKASSASHLSRDNSRVHDPENDNAPTPLSRR